MTSLLGKSVVHKLWAEKSKTEGQATRFNRFLSLSCQLSSYINKLFYIVVTANFS